MLEKCKLALRVSTDVFDDELLDLIAAGIADIKHAGPRFESSYTAATQTTHADYTINDELVSRAVITYVRMMFGSPADYDRLKASYDEQKGQLRESSDYGMEAL